MKKSMIRLLCACGVLAAMACGALALASGDSLLTLSYLTDQFIPSAVEEGTTLVNGQLNEAFEESVNTLDKVQDKTIAQLAGTDSDVSVSATLAPREWSEGDLLEVPTGSGVLLEAGGALVVHNGAFVDVTEGSEVPAGSNLSTGHRYLVGEDTQAQVFVISGAARMGVQGQYLFTDGGVKATPFYDVLVTDWYHDAVDYVYRNKLFSGMGEHEFAPAADMNRAMLMTVLYRLAGSPEREMAAADVSFDDVPADAWFAPFVRWGASQNVTAGTGNNCFSPNQQVTRQQVVVLLYSFANKYMGLNTRGQTDLSGYQDADRVSDWAREGMSWAVAKGIVGDDLLADGLLAPQRNASRAEVAAMLHAFSEKIL